MAEFAPGVMHHSDLDFVEYVRRRHAEFDKGLNSADADARREAENKAAYEYARMALEAFYPGMGDGERLRVSQDLVSVVRDEESRRGAHYHRFRLMTRAALDQPLFADRPSELTLPELGLLDLKAKMDDMDDETYAFAKDLYRGKGISGELGYVDQLGDWDSARPLDQAMRDLPASNALAQTGFRFGNLYDSKDQAKLGYTFNVSGTLGNTLMIAKRKRAAADVHADGATYEVVKLSSFLVSERFLTLTERQQIDRVKQLGDVSKPTAKEKALLDGAVEEAGMTIVEPLIADRAAREDHAGAIAATSLYFALHRHR